MDTIDEILNNLPAGLISGIEGDTRSYLEQEQEFLRNGGREEDLGRFYPNLVGNGHPDVCLCRECAPGEYEDCSYPYTGLLEEEDPNSNEESGSPEVNALIDEYDRLFPIPASIVAGSAEYYEYAIEREGKKDAWVEEKAKAIIIARTAEKNEKTRQEAEAIAWIEEDFPF